MIFNILKYWLLLYCMFFWKLSFSQNINMDSCLQVLKTAKQDTNKVILLDKIAWNIAYTNLKKGIDYSIQSYELAKKLHYEEKYSRICNTMGAIYADMAQVPKALDLYHEGLKYAKKYNQLGMYAAIYNSLGNLYGTTGELKKALSYYLLGAEYLQKTYPNKLPIAAYSNVAGIYTSLNKPDSAMYYVNLCLDYNLKHDNISGLANNYISLSEIYFAANNKEKCLDAARNAVYFANKMSDDYTLSHACIQLGNALDFNGMYEEAFKVIGKAIEYTKKTGDIPALELATEYLSNIYEKTGDYKNSLKYFKEYKIYRDSTLNNESIQQVKNAEAKYENEKKQKEIELLGEKQKLNDAENQKKKVYLAASSIGIIALGFVLVILYRNNRLKQKTNQNLEAFNKEVNHQKELIEEKNKEITDSINYAKRIQQSILTGDNYFKRHTTDYFILFKPKDIVSGDFYWALNYEERFMVMTADCTGHGVPGAMMSMMGINFLNEIVNEKKISSPAAVLNQLRKEIIEALNPEDSILETKDGMDCCLCSFDLSNRILTYSNANNNFYIIRNNELITSKTNKMPVGVGHNTAQLFDEHTFELEKGDVVITLTDGYADQFGGPKGKKFKYKQIEELLLSGAHLPLEQIKQKLNNSIELWKGDLEQVDDICIIGIKI